MHFIGGSSNVKKSLIYSQDPGGAKFLAPVIAKLYKDGRLPHSTVIMAHPLSEDILSDYEIPFEKLADEIVDSPVSIFDWEVYLKNARIQAVFMSTSSPYKDLSNCNLVEACRNLQCPSIGVLDHWKGIDRFYKDNELRYMPDEICCIDEYCRDAISKLGISNKRIHVVGHPSLEESAINDYEKICFNTGTLKILLISQPIIIDKSFSGIFFLKEKGRRIIDVLVEKIKNICKKNGVKTTIVYRQHPKELKEDKLPESVEMDSHQRWSDSLSNHQVFIGYDSMALIEANVTGMPCISLNLPIFRDIAERVPFQFDYSSHNLSGLENIFTNIIKKDYHDANKKPHSASFLGSTARLSCEIESLLNSTTVVGPQK